MVMVVKVKTTKRTKTIQGVEKIPGYHGIPQLVCADSTGVQ
jgi:hypothetical protein